MNQRLVALLTGLSMAAASALATAGSRLPLYQGAAPTTILSLWLQGLNTPRP